MFPSNQQLESRTIHSKLPLNTLQNLFHFTYSLLERHFSSSDRSISLAVSEFLGSHHHTIVIIVLVLGRWSFDWLLLRSRWHLLGGESLEGKCTALRLLLLLTVFVLGLVVAVFNLHIKLDALEHLERHELQDEAPNQLTSANGEADTILLHVQGVSLDKLATDLDENHLNDDG